MPPRPPVRAGTRTPVASVPGGSGARPGGCPGGRGNGHASPIVRPQAPLAPRTDGPVRGNRCLTSAPRPHAQTAVRAGGTDGRPPAPHPALPETHIRPQLLRLAVLPPVAVALSGCAAVLFTVRSTGARPSLTPVGRARRRGLGDPRRSRRRRGGRQPGRPAPCTTASAPCAASTARQRGRPARPGRDAAPRRRPAAAQSGRSARRPRCGRRRLRTPRRRPDPRARRRRHRRRPGRPALQPGGQRTEARGVRQPRPAPAVTGAPRDLHPRRAGERDRGPRPAQGALPRRPPRHPHPPPRREPRRARRRRLPPPVEQPGLHDRGAALGHRRGRAVLAGQTRAADRRHPARPRRRRRHPPAGRTRRERHGVLRPAHPGAAARQPRHLRARRRGRGPWARHARRASRRG